MKIRPQVKQIGVKTGLSPTRPANQGRGDHKTQAKRIKPNKREQSVAGKHTPSLSACNAAQDIKNSRDSRVG